MACLNNAAVLGCYNGTPVVLHYTYDNSGQPQVRITNLAGTVIAGATVANTVVGECVPVHTMLDSSGLNIASGTFSPSFDPDNNGATWTPPVGFRLQSFTVTALRGTGVPNATNFVRVTFGLTGQRRFLLQGETVSWSVAQQVESNEYITSSITVACIGNAAAGIHWVGQIL